MIRVLSGQEAGDDDLVGITNTPGPELQPPKLIELLASGCAVVRGIPFDGQVPENIPADSWPQIYLELSSLPPFVTTSEPLVIVAKLKAAVDRIGKTAGGGWHRLTVAEAELEKLRAVAERVYPLPPPLLITATAEPSPPPIPISEAAEQLAHLNPGVAADFILARVKRTIDRGNLVTIASAETHNPAAAPAELAYWAEKRALARPSDWLPPKIEGELEDEQEEDPDPYMTIFEAATWIAYRTAEPTEAEEIAIEKKLLPALKTGRLVATGRKDRSSPPESIPKTHWRDAELTYAPDNARLWLAGERNMPPLYERIMVERSDVEECWPGRSIISDETAGADGSSGGRVSRGASQEPLFSKSDPDDLRLAAEDECVRRLITMLSEGPPDGRSRPKIKEGLLSEISHLTGKGFDRAWGFAVRDPEVKKWGWTRAGRRPSKIQNGGRN